VDKVNWKGGTAVEKVSACKSGGIARPGGVIPGAQVGGGANVLPCAGLWLPALCCV